MRRFDYVLHLHRFEHDQWLILGDPLALHDGDLDYSTGHRRGQSARATTGAAIARGVRHAKRQGTWQAQPGVGPSDAAAVPVDPQNGTRPTADTDALPRAEL